MNGSFTIALSGSGLGIYGYQKPVATPETENEVVTAMPSVLTEAAAGLYDGLLRDDADGQTLLGALESLRLTKTGAASGKLRLNGKTVTLRPLFGESGLADGTLVQRDGSEIVWSLQLMDTTGAGEKVIRGTVSWEGTEARADLPKAPFHKTIRPVPVEQAGRFTLLMPAPIDREATEPGGDSWASVVISSAGGVRLTGVLGDGTRWTESAFLSGHGEFSLFGELYRSTPKGRVGGRISFRELEDVSDLDGKIQWVKLPQPSDAAFPTGFSVERWAVGSRFLAPPSGSFILPGLELADPNASVSLWGTPLPDLEEDARIIRVASWRTNHRLQHFGPDRLLGSANRTSGTFSGSFRPAAGGRALALRGVVFQKQDLAAGHFVFPGGSGLFRVTPSTDTAFPGSEDPGALADVVAPANPAATPPAAAVVLAEVAGFAGIYGGIISDDDGAPIGALENVRLSATGAFSLVLWNRGQRYVVTGSLDANGEVSGLAVGGSGLTLDLRLERISPEGSFVLRGSLQEGLDSWVIDSQIRPTHSAADPSPHQGSYTLAVRAPMVVNPETEPAGDGYASLSVNRNGLVKGSLVLADGSKTSFAGHVSREGEWSLHRGLYGRVPRGYLTGKLTFRAEDGISDVDGIWSWVKQNGAAPASVYPSGFDTSRQVIGSIYVRPARNQRAIGGLADDFYNAWARLAGVDMAPAAPNPVEQISKAVSWRANNQIVYYGVDRFSLKLNAATGVVTGTYQDRARGIQVRCAAVILQKQQLVPGHYLQSGQSGRFQIEPRLID